MTRAYPERPRVGVAAVVFDPVGAHVLLIRRARPPHAGQWALPGGAQELGETVFAAAARELREETGVTAVPETVLTAVDSIHRDEWGEVAYHYTLIDVLARYAHGSPESGGDGGEAHWAALAELDRYGLWPPLRRVIERAAELESL